MREVDGGNVEQVTIAGQKVSGVYRRGNEAFYTYAPAQYKDDLGHDLNAKGIATR